MEQLLLCGKDGWVVPSLAGGVWGRAAMDGWDSGWVGPLPTSTSICYSCPTPNSFTSTNAIFQALEPPTQPAGHSFGQLAHVLLQWEEKCWFTSTHTLHLAGCQR